MDNEEVGHMPVVVYDIGVEAPTTPDAPLPPLPPMPRDSLLVITGRAPIWRYGLALHKVHASRAAAVAFYDPRLGAVVVASHSPRVREGQVVPLELD